MSHSFYNLFVREVCLYRLLIRHERVIIKNTMLPCVLRALLSLPVLTFECLPVNEVHLKGPVTGI